MAILFIKMNYFIYTILFVFGIFVMMFHRNLIKKLIGMYFLQTSIILFYISLASKHKATVPILEKNASSINPELYVNPLPHVLMLTAIVVGVSTLGVSLAIVIKIYQKYRTLNENEILKKINEVE